MPSVISAASAARPPAPVVIKPAAVPSRNSRREILKSAIRMSPQIKAYSCERNTHINVQGPCHQEASPMSFLRVRRQDESKQTTRDERPCPHPERRKAALASAHFARALCAPPAFAAIGRAGARD